MIEFIIQLNYFTYLNYIDYIKLLLTCKVFYNNNIYNNDKIFKYYLINKYSENFINILRQVLISHYIGYPYIISYRECYIKTFTFEKYLKKYGITHWNEESYYDHWKNLNILSENKYINNDKSMYISEIQKYENKIILLENKINNLLL